MRILHVVTLVSGTGAFGGPTSVAVAQLNYLQSQGNQVLLIGLHDLPAAPQSYEGVPTRLFRARQLVPRMSFSGLLNLRLIPALWREVGRARLVHVHTGRDLVSITALLICRLRHTPYVTQTHGMVMPRSNRVSAVFDSVLRPALIRARARFVLTDVEQAGLAAVTRGAPMHRLANGVRPGSPAGRRPSDRPAVVFLARLHERKRPQVFVAAAVASDVRARFVVYGPDEGELAAVQARIAAAGPAVDISYGGALAHEDAVAVLAAAELFVLPSVDEPFPMTVLEALSRGTPVVCTDTCGLAPAIAEDGGGVVTDGSVAQVAAAIEHCLGTDWPQLSEQAVALIENRFSIDAVGAELLASYRTVLAVESQR